MPLVVRREGKAAAVMELFPVAKTVGPTVYSEAGTKGNYSVAKRAKKKVDLLEASTEAIVVARLVIDSVVQWAASTVAEMASTELSWVSSQAACWGTRWDYRGAVHLVMTEAL